MTMLRRYPAASRWWVVCIASGLLWQTLASVTS